jgi:acetylornithine deacetylase/succinyl-diaminopimelate desuccinylase-like protein
MPRSRCFIAMFSRSKAGNSASQPAIEYSREPDKKVTGKATNQGREEMTPINTLHQIDQYINNNLDRFIADLGELCAQPSISAQNIGIQECATLVADMLRRYGVEADIIPSAGNPIVYGEAHGRSDKTMLFYLHYDVQPAEPLELWDSPPFQLTQRNGLLVARGVSDDKGHIVTRLAALAALRHVLGDLPCQVKFVIEGEEEIGSPSMTPFVGEHQARLAADGCIWEFGSVDYDGRPIQSLGMRGICYVELSVQTADVDAHSGLGGSVFPNAAWRLVWALASLKNSQEKILLPGFYDKAAPPTAADLEMMANLPPEMTPTQALYGLRGFLPGINSELDYQRTAVFEPTCTICGLDSGYQGPGSKTVLPAEARAKVDFRLVPDQSPSDVLQQLRRHLDDHGFADVQITYMGGTKPARTDPADPLVKLAVSTAAQVYGIDPVVLPLVGGSGPNHPFIHTLGLPVVTSGIGHPGGRVHAPNENVRLVDLVNGIRHTAYMLAGFGDQVQPNQE